MDPRCERALELLWGAGVDETPDAPELVEARRHLAACPPCRAFLRRDSVLAARLRDLRLCGASPCPESVRRALARELEWETGAPTADLAVGAAGLSPDAVPAATGEAAPGEGSDTNLGLVDQLKENVIDRLQERHRRWPPWVEGLVAAAAATVLIAGGLVLSQQLDAGLPDEAFVEDFHRTALPEIVRQDVPRPEVEAFYRAQFGDAGPAFMLDAPVTKVAVCNLDGRMGALVEYQWSGERLVYYQVPRPEGGSVRRLRTDREGELSVARWGDARYDYALVSSMPDEELAQLARSART